MSVVPEHLEVLVPSDVRVEVSHIGDDVEVAVEVEVDRADEVGGSEEVAVRIVQGDRASVVFASPKEFSQFVQSSCS